jgi:hypothetical protein
MERFSTPRLLSAVAVLLLLLVGQDLRGQTICTNCTIPQGNCVLVQPPGYMNCDRGPPCEVWGTCPESDDRRSITATGESTFVPERPWLTGAGVGPFYGTIAARNPALPGWLEEGRLFERGCSGIVLGRSYAAAIGAKLRLGTRQVRI